MPFSYEYSRGIFYYYQLRSIRCTGETWVFCTCSTLTVRRRLDNTFPPARNVCFPKLRFSSNFTTNDENKKRRAFFAFFTVVYFSRFKVGSKNAFTGFIFSISIETAKTFRDSPGFLSRAFLITRNVVVVVVDKIFRARVAQSSRAVRQRPGPSLYCVRKRQSVRNRKRRYGVTGNANRVSKCKTIPRTRGWVWRTTACYST